MGSCSRLLQGGGLGLLLPGSLDAAMCSDGLRLSILSLLDDGLELSTEGSSIGVIRHGDRIGQRTSSGMNSAGSEMNSTI
jgi:hypothetical protein